MSVDLEFSDSAAILTLNRSDALNALSFSILGEIGGAFDRVASSKARILFIRGAGDKAFCAGADIKELRHRGLVAQKQGAELGQSVFAKLPSLPMPSVALINGYAFGGGLELALACTFRLAVVNAKMGLPEIKLGLIPGYGGTQRLPRIIGEARALEMIGNTAAYDVTGNPALSLPCGTVDGLPVGLMLVARDHGESIIYQDAAAYEQAVDWEAL